MPNQLGREVIRVEELRDVCAKLHVELEALQEVVAGLSEACNAASAAHTALQHQVQQMADCIDSPPEGEAALQLEYVGTMQGHLTDLGHLLAAERGLGTSVVEAAKAVNDAGEGWRQHWHDAQGGAVNMRAALMTRANRWRPASRLLHLPDGPLHSIARRSGLHSRHVCTGLRDVYGPPGTTLAPPSHTPVGRPLTHTESTIFKLIESWSQPAAIRHLHLITTNVTLGPTFCDSLATALPNLQFLSCHRLRPPTPLLECPGGPPTVSPLTALTSLTVSEATADLRCLPALAPRLRALNVTRLLRDDDVTADHLWGRLSALPHLQRLHLKLAAIPLLYASLPQHLPGLTHLGLNFVYFHQRPPPPDALRDLARRLAALPGLRSLLLHNIELAGRGEGAVGAAGGVAAPGSAGAALQAIDLQRLEIAEVSGSVAAASPSAHESLPDLSCMPRLQHFSLELGRTPLSAAVMRRLFGASAPALASLHLGVDEADLALLLDLLPLVPALTSLRFTERRRRGAAVPLAALEAALAQQTRLRELHFGTLPSELLPALEGLPALTSLTLGLREATGGAEFLGRMRGLERLTGLRHLSLGTINEGSSGQGRRRCLQAVCRLPRLEHLGLRMLGWTPDELCLLQQAPSLRRVTTAAALGGARGALGSWLVVDTNDLAMWKEFSGC